MKSPLLPLVFLFMIGCDTNPMPSQRVFSQPPTIAPPAETAEPEELVKGIAWRTDEYHAYHEHLKRADPLLIYFTRGEECAPCLEVEHKVFADAGYIRLVNETCVPLYVDTRTPAGAKIAKRYDVKGTPAIRLRLGRKMMRWNPSPELGNEARKIREYSRWLRE